MAADGTCAAESHGQESRISLSRSADSVVCSHCRIHRRIALCRFPGARADRPHCANCRRRSNSPGTIGSGADRTKAACNCYGWLGSGAHCAFGHEHDPYCGARFGHRSGSQWAYRKSRAPGRQRHRLLFWLPTISDEWVEVLKEVVPNLNGVAVLWDPATGPPQVKAVEEAAGVLNLKLEILKTQSRDDIAGSFASAARLNVGAVLILSSPALLADLNMSADLAL